MQLEFTPEEKAIYAKLNSISTELQNALFLSLSKENDIRSQEDLEQATVKVLQSPELANIFAQQSLAILSFIRLSGEHELAVISAVLANFEFDTSNLELLLGKIVRCKPIRLLANSSMLEYDYPCILKTFRVLSDIRPIFSPDADVVEGAVLALTMRIRYVLADGEEKDLGIVIDRDDLAKILNQCERAQTKFETISKFLEATDVVNLSKED